MLYLKDATYIDHQTLDFKQTDIMVTESGKGNPEFISSGNIPADAVVLDCKGMLVTKSFACGHHHVYSALARGMGATKKIPENFLEILQYVWWTLDKCLDLEMIEASALVTAMACARNGVTFVIDHHASPYAVEGSLETIAKAFDQVGVSHLLCYEISDRDGMEIAEKGLLETENYLQKHQGLVGLHAGFTIGNETLGKALLLAKKYNRGIHVHVAEDRADEEFSLQHYGKRVIERFHEAGVLDFSSTILGHCIHLDDHERKLVKDSKTWVAQNTESNLNNNVGSFTSAGFGDRIMLGTDGMHSDMLRAVKATFFNSVNADYLDYLVAYRRFRKVHDYLSVNGFEGDGANNLVVLDYKTPTEINKDNFAGHFIFGIESSHVRHVISGGRLIVRDRCIQNVDEEDILINSRKLATKLWKKMQQ
jgi:cytosine/adenosine deaminase-related metal-dependent hydrolase